MRTSIRNGLLAGAALAPLLLQGAADAGPKDKKGPIDEVAEKYNKARAPQKEKNQPMGVPVALRPGDCKDFAKDFIKAAEKERAREAEGLFNAGVVYDQCGMPKDAEDLYKRALQRNPKFAPAMNNLGVMYQNAGRSDQARAQFEAAVRADPKSALAVQAYNNKAALEYEMARRGGGSNFNDAIGSLRRALAVDASSVQAYSLLAQIYYQTAEQDRSKLKLAQLVCDEAKKINDDYAPIYNTLGLIKLRSKDVTGALNDFRKAAALDPGFIEAQLNIAAISLSSRSYKQAEEAFVAVLKKQPNNLDANIGLGVAFRGQKKIDEAEAQYKKVLQLDQRNCAVQYNLGVLYHDYKASPEDMRVAQKYYNTYVGCGRTDPEKVADSRRRLKDIDDTFKAIEEQKKLDEELKKMQELERQQQQQLQQQQGAAPGGAAAPAAAPAAPAKK